MPAKEKKGINKDRQNGNEKKERIKESKKERIEY